MNRTVFTILLSIILTLSILTCVIEEPIHLRATSVHAAGGNKQATNVQLLARCVNGEARGEPYEGQVAVAAVILNRVNHPSFPNTLSGVIYQPGAFTAVSDGQISVPIDPSTPVYKACNEAMNGSDPTSGAIYYYNPNTATNSWIRSRKIIKTIGKHKFAI